MIQVLPSLSSSSNSKPIPPGTRLKCSTGVRVLAQQLLNYKDSVADAKIELLDAEDLQEKIMKDVETAEKESQKARALLSSQKVSQDQRQKKLEEKLRILHESCSSQQPSSSPPFVSSVPPPVSSFTSSTNCGAIPNGFQSFQNGGPRYQQTNSFPCPPQGIPDYTPPQNSTQSKTLPPPHFFY